MRRSVNRFLVGRYMATPRLCLVASRHSTARGDACLRERRIASDPEWKCWSDAARSRSPRSPGRRAISCRWRRWASSSSSPATSPTIPRSRCSCSPAASPATSSPTPTSTTSTALGRGEPVEGDPGVVGPRLRAARGDAPAGGGGDRRPGVGRRLRARARVHAARRERARPLRPARGRGRHHPRRRRDATATAAGRGGPGRRARSCRGASSTPTEALRIGLVEAVLPDRRTSSTASRVGAADGDQAPAALVRREARDRRRAPAPPRRRAAPRRSAVHRVSDPARHDRHPERGSRTPSATTPPGQHIELG